METVLLVAIFGCAIALLFVITSPSAQVTDAELRRFPELARFESPDQADRALRRAFGGFWGPRLFAFVLVGVPACLLVGYSETKLFNLMDCWGIFVLPGGAKQIIVTATVSICGPAAITSALSRRIRASLRRQLRELDVPICTNCGYDLTGNTSGICPECGKSSTTDYADKHG